jgi:exodeoxyribonuclease-3
VRRSGPSWTRGSRTSSAPSRPARGVYTYWDYTQLRFARREGMRIDFILASPALARSVTGALIDRQERKGKGASDHAPVVVDLA